MWIQSKYGFTSVTRTKSGDFQMRFREIKHAKAHAKAFRIPGDLITTTDSDYPYRFIVHENAWERISSELMASIDYGNFKDACWDNHKWYMFLNKLWTLYRGEQDKSIKVS
jgi:hypothetical protein